MWKWYKNGIKYLHSYDIDSVCLGAFFLGIMVGSLCVSCGITNINPMVYFTLGVGFLAAPVYKFIKRGKLSFKPEVIVKTVVKEIPAKTKSATKKKAPAKKTTTKKASAKKATVKKTATKKTSTAKKAPAKKTTKK